MINYSKTKRAKQLIEEGPLIENKVYTKTIIIKQNQSISNKAGANAFDKNLPADNLMATCLLTM